jgi:uncharacterized membrane protein YeaQ/YmgE (transglycosylase-associated protein family)
MKVVMNGLAWFLVAGGCGWLIGKIIGQSGYGKALGGYADGLDILLGIVGASVGGYFFLSSVIGESSKFSAYGTAILGSITLVGVVRLISARLASISR